MRALPAVWTRRSVFLANVLSFVIGLAFAVTAASLSDQQVLATTLNHIGDAFFSTPVVTLLLDPVRGRVLAGSMVAYRWDCLLARPLPDDDHPDYAYQSMRISYRIDSLPSAVRLVCAASRDDRALEPFRADDFIFRWLVDDGLDPTDPMVFLVGGVWVDSKPLKGRPGSTAKVAGGTACARAYEVPRRLRQTVGHTVELQVLVRKFVGRETRLRIQAQLFRSATDAEYRLSVDPGLKVTRLWPSAAEVSAIGIARGGAIEATYRPPFDGQAAIVHLPFPLQPGSTVAFLVDREPSVDDG